MSLTTASPFVYQPASPWPCAKGNLAGLRLAVKDLFDIDGLPTGAGNPDWLASHPIPTRTSPAVSMLLASGAEFVGKTLTDELAYSLNGQNMHYGTPRNPRAPDRLPGGSSSGSAVAVAQDIADIGLGTDTGGSIRVPASYNGLYGLRTSHGAISTDNIVGLAPAFDTVGWMCRDLATLTRVADVLLAEQPIADVSHTLRLIHANQLTKLVSQHQLIEQQLARWQHNAAIVELGSGLSTAHLTSASETFRILQGRQIWAQHGQWITRQQPTIADDIRQRLEWCASLTAADESRAQLSRQVFSQHIEALMRGADGLIIPTTPGPAPKLSSDVKGLSDYRNQLLGLTAIAGLCGLPQLHIPLNDEQGVPMGVSVIGQPNQDRQLLRIAAQLGAE